MANSKDELAYIKAHEEEGLVFKDFSSEQYGGHTYGRWKLLQQAELATTDKSSLKGAESALKHGADRISIAAEVKSIPPQKTNLFSQVNAQITPDKPAAQTPPPDKVKVFTGVNGNMPVNAAHTSAKVQAAPQNAQAAESNASSAAVLDKAVRTLSPGPDTLKGQIQSGRSQAAPEMRTSQTAARQEAAAPAVLDNAVKAVSPNSDTLRAQIQSGRSQAAPEPRTSQTAARQETGSHAVLDPPARTVSPEADPLRAQVQSAQGPAAPAQTPEAEPQTTRRNTTPLNANTVNTPVRQALQAGRQQKFGTRAGMGYRVVSTGNGSLKSYIQSSENSARSFDSAYDWDARVADNSGRRATPRTSRDFARAEGYSGRSSAIRRRFGGNTRPDGRDSDSLTSIYQRILSCR